MTETLFSFDERNYLECQDDAKDVVVFWFVRRGRMQRRLNSLLRLSARSCRTMAHCNN